MKCSSSLLVLLIRPDWASLSLPSLFRSHLLAVKSGFKAQFHTRASPMSPLRQFRTHLSPGDCLDLRL